MKKHKNTFWVVAFTILVTAVVTFAGPIKGLVDVGTGEEIADADLRYVLLANTNSVAWFTNLYVVTDATAGTEVVNWNTMTNYVAGIPTTPPATNTTTLKFTQDGVLFEAIGSGDYRWESKLATTNGTGAAGEFIARRAGVGWPFVNTYLAQGNGATGLYSKETESDNSKEVWLAQSTYGAGRFLYGGIGTERDVRLGTADYAINVVTGDTSLARAFTSHDATNATEIVNWQTMVNYIDNLPSTNIISVANVAYDGNWAPTSSNAFDFGSALNPVRTGYFHTVRVSTNSLFIGDVALSSDGSDILWDGETIATESALDVINTSQESIAFSASSSEDWAHTNLAHDAFALTRGRIWVSNTNNNPFDATATVTWYVESDRHGEDALWRADVSLVQVLVNGAVTAPTNTITVDDASSFSANDLVVIYDGDSTEYARIESINSNDLTFEDDLSSNVDDDAGISRVGEYGGFSLHGTNKTVWGRATFSSGQTVDLSNWLEYKK